MLVSDRELMAKPLPWYMGVANRKFTTRQVSVYPIPFNLLANWWVRAVNYIRYDRPSDRLFIMLDDASADGYERGFMAANQSVGRRLEAAAETAYTTGWNAALDAVQNRTAK